MVKQQIHKTPSDQYYSTFHIFLFLFLNFSSYLQKLISVESTYRVIYNLFLTLHEKQSVEGVTEVGA